VKYLMGKNRIGEILVSTGTDHFGAVVGNNCAIGASVIILPGRQFQLQHYSGRDISWEMFVNFLWKVIQDVIDC
jgi:hypothetical protein